eukprot:3428853-Prymnesium_polylepis.1
MPLVLDGASSRDPSSHPAREGSLHYQWQCMEARMLWPRFHPTACITVNDYLNTSGMMWMPTLDLPAFTLPVADANYSFRLTVSSSVDSRTASTSVIVVSKVAAAPPL